ncbi:MAG: diguanylate cyclase domain-containing protein [Solimonas sp.]
MRGLTRAQTQRSQRRRTDDISAADVQLIEAIALARTRRYRFPPGLETLFQEYARVSARTARISVALLTFLLFAAAPLWTPLAFSTPEQTSGLMTIIELAVMAPLFGALTIALARRPASELVEWLLIVAFVFEMLTVECIRYFSGRAGFEIDPSIAVTVPVAIVSLARLRVSRCLLFIALYFGGAIVTSMIWSDSIAHRGPTAWMMEVILIGMVLLSVVWTRLSLRRQWAGSLLLEILAYRDALTGLANRRAFEEHYETVSRALTRGQQKTMLFALVDLDHFKALNDHYGHDYGDGVLAEIGLALAGAARRPLDMSARLGGEEFAVLLYDCSADAVDERGQAIVDAVRLLGIEHQGSAAGVVSCSVGVVLVGPGEALSDVYRQADARLYQVKRGGRDGFRASD